MFDPSQQDPPSRPPNAAFRGARSLDLVGNAQTIGALLAGILLFAVPLYLWRRPRAAPLPIHTDAGMPEAGAHEGGGIAPPLVDAGHPRHVKIADPRVLECHDRGSRRTPPDQCDHITPFEKAFADAIEAAHDCVPAAAGQGAIEFVADLSFARRRHPVVVTVPKDGRSFQSAKIAKECAAGVRARLAAFPVAPLTHAHARYKVSFVASYGAVMPP
jgi:hypothetical protein